MIKVTPSLEIPPISYYLEIGSISLIRNYHFSLLATSYSLLPSRYCILIPMSFLRSTSGLLLVAILILSGVAQLYGAFSNSGTMDELAHIPAGYGYAKYLDFRLNPEHPPLLKLLSGLPLAFADLDFPVDSRSWTTSINGQWDAGFEFLYRSGNDAATIFRLARLGPILLTLILILLVFVWAKSLVGTNWALLPTFLTAFAPTVLGHGHLVTTDIAAALGALLATSAFVRFLTRPTWPRIILAGIAYGIAQLLKYSLILLVPCFGIIFLVFLWARRYRRNKFQESQPREFSARRYFAGVFLIALIGYGLVVYPVYAILVSNYPAEKQLSDSQFYLATYAEGPTEPGRTCAPLRCPADLTLNMISSPVLRPLAHYLVGLMMVTQRTIGGNTAYFLGEVSNTGSTLYFPILYLTKEPLPTLIFILIAILWTAQAIYRRTKSNKISDLFSEYALRNLPAFAMASWIAIYWLTSIKTPLNIGVRHLLPTFPFAYLLATLAWHRVVGTVRPPGGQTILHYLWTGFREAVGQAVKYGTLALLLIWFSFSVIGSFPYYISYFNSMAGGTMNGYKIATDSNYDWGQDLYRLRDWVESENRRCALVETADPCGIKKVAVDYFGSGNPAYELKKVGVEAEEWKSSRGNPKDQNIHWLAISANSLQGAIQPKIDILDRKEWDEYRWLTDLRGFAPPVRRSVNEGGELKQGDIPPPDYRIGTSIFIYKL